MIRARRTGLLGFVSVAYGLTQMTPAELLSFANLARTQGYHGAADAALAEMAARVA